MAKAIYPWWFPLPVKALGFAFIIAGCAVLGHDLQDWPLALSIYLIVIGVLATLEVFTNQIRGIYQERD